MKSLSLAAQSLWAKKSTKDGNLLWLPLIIHMKDAAWTARKLWNRWLPEGIKKAIAGEIGEQDLAKQLAMFLAAVHDLGKATPVFQAKHAYPPQRELDDVIEKNVRAAGLPMKNQREFEFANKTPHALATQVLLEEYGCNRNAAAILGAHHGKPPGIGVPDRSTISAYGFNYHLEGEGKMAWSVVQRELMSYALDLAGFSSMDEVPVPPMAAQVLLSGLLIMTDWVVSNEQYYPYIHLGDSAGSIKPEIRMQTAWRKLALPAPWQAPKLLLEGHELFQSRFSFKPNTLQLAVTETAAEIHRPGIMVMEAPMGMGKTEAALACAEIFAGKTGRSGVFFALPSQATSDGIFTRLCKWIEKLDLYGGYSINLAHGRAQFNDEFQAHKRMEGSTQIGHDEESSLVVHEWFEGQKKSMLADFVAGTIDQLLLAALRQKHVMLRHLGLAGKVVIIDECHAYDAYMGQYLNRALHWLGAYGVPVVVLSATLPAAKRQDVIEAYLNKSDLAGVSVNLFGEPIGLAPQPSGWAESRDYPLLTYSDGGKVKQRSIVLEDDSKLVDLVFLVENQLVKQLEDLLSHGGCVGIIVNTVRRSQEIAQQIREHFGEEIVQLLHSRFLAPDRTTKEQTLLKELGKTGAETERPEKRIVVGTQVLEQSLDIDFDLLITDIAPMDLLLQRIGRLHRHTRRRPEKLTKAQCLIMGCDENGFEAGASNIYGEYLLMRTKSLLPNQLQIPQDIPSLVQNTYDEDFDISPEPIGYTQAKKEQKKRIDSKEERARKFRIDPVWPGSNQNLVGWLDTYMSQQHGEAAVRDIDESIEVLLVRKNGKGNICFLPWVEGGCVISENEVPPYELGKALARQRIRLPGSFCAPWNIDDTIKELEKINSARLLAWQQSPWLKGELFLVLDQENSARLSGYRLTYCQQNGLLYEKEATADV
ncbi:MAG: CRISPR-associated nuclease/helicase Cas3 [Firmicutes bacterium]|nr:CRISPR-associated nuclease/helicase Cas3 [Bacillota bacterium]